VKVCDKTCIFLFFPIINKYFFNGKTFLLSRCPSYVSVQTNSKFVDSISEFSLKVNTLSLEEIKEYKVPRYVTFSSLQMLIPSKAQISSSENLVFKSKGKEVL